MLARRLSPARRTTAAAGVGRSHRLVLGFALVVAVGGLAACGTSAHASAAPTTTTTAPANGFAAYRTCLQQHGVSGSFGRRGAGGGDPTATAGGAGTTPSSTVDPATLQAAQQACQSVAPSRGAGGGFGGAGGAGGGGGAGFNLAGTPYGQCLQQHGVSTGNGAGAGGIDRTSAAFQAAQTACASLRPARGGQAPTSPTTSSS